MEVKHYGKQLKERVVKLSIQRGNICQVAKEVVISDGQLSKCVRLSKWRGLNIGTTKTADTPH